ncbi:MAG TPA: RidA family protein [Vicinamibacterales bacterium]|jgi:enamine deaminase RidA (YjgF/YER057c/UK114 family)|nr:RidA family protein [Vicinamibacterales bacterium]
MNDTSSVRLFNPPTMHKPFGYSHVAEVMKGKLIYIAGQVAIDEHGSLVGKDDFTAQVNQVFRNLTAALDAASFHNVIKLNYYCADSVDPATQLPAVRAVRDRFVNTETPPASTFVVVRRLVQADWLIEIEAVAVVPS